MFERIVFGKSGIESRTFRMLLNSDCLPLFESQTQLIIG